MAQEFTHVLAGPGANGPWQAVPIADVLLPVEPEPPVDSPFVPAGYVRTFADDFNEFDIWDAEKAPDGARWIGSWKKWNVRYLSGNEDKGLKIVIPETHVAGDRGIVLRGLNQPATAQSGGKQVTLPFTGAMISTELSHAQKFGYFEARARIETSKGHHVALWLLHKDGSYNRVGEICETDMVEALNGKKTLHFNHIGLGAEKMTEVEGDPAAWHVYGLLWEADRMVWYLDGREVRRSSKVMPRDAYFLASIEIGGKWPGPPDVSTAWPCEVELDYVRIYQKS